MVLRATLLAGLLIGAGTGAAERPAIPVAGVARTIEDADWRQDGGDAGRSGHQAVTGDLDPAAARRLQQVWTSAASRKGEQIGGAVVVDGTLFRSSGGPSGQVRRYDAVTGDDLGPLVDAPGRDFGQLAVVSGTDPSAITSSPNAAGRGAGEGDGAGDVIVVESLEHPSGQRRLTAFSLRGEPRWEVLLGEGVSGGYTVGHGLIGRSAGDTLSAYRVTDGSVAWTAPLGAEPGYHPPVFAGDLLVQAAEPGTLLAFDAETGAKRWERPSSGPEVIASGDGVYTVGEAGICAYAAADGAQRWCDTESPESPVHASLDPQRRSLYVVDGHGSLAAFDASTGRRTWRMSYGLGGEVDASYWAPVNGGGVVYAVAYHFRIVGGVSTHRVELLAADAESGVLLTRVDLPVDAMRGGEPLLLSGDHVYFASLQRLYAVAAPDGY